MFHWGYREPLLNSILPNVLVMPRYGNLLIVECFCFVYTVSGRKVLLSVSASFMAVSIAALGIYFQLNDPKQPGEFHQN